MPDYALMNQYLYEGKAKEVEQMTKDALAEGRHFAEVLSVGGGVSPGMPRENIRAMLDALNEFNGR